MSDLAYYPWGAGSGAAPGQAATLSFYENMDFLPPASTTLNNSQSTIHVLPFTTPQAISVSVIRVPVSMSAVSTEVAGTSANTSFVHQRLQTDAFVIYSQGTGANSNSLQYVTSGGANWTMQSTWTAGTAGSQYSFSWAVTFPAINFGTTTSDAANSAFSTSAYQIVTGGHTRLTGARLIDLPAAFSLAPGNYWIGFGRSTSHSSNAGPANLSNGSLGFSTVAVSQSNISWGYPGVATNNSIQIEPGLGNWTTNSAVMSTSSMALSDISAVVSNPKMYFQMIRRA